MGVDGASGNKTDSRAALAARFPRLEQTFPALAPQEIARMRGFGELRNYKDGERLFETGKPGPGMFVILSGHIAISQRDGLGHVTSVIEQGPGQFLAEIGQPSLRRIRCGCWCPRATSACSAIRAERSSPGGLA